MYSPTGGANNTGGYGSVFTNLYTDPEMNNKIAMIQTQSDPLGVDPDDEFGFSENITEYYDGNGQ
jgi:hypothetical protein